MAQSARSWSACALPAPPTGSGYRIRVEDALDPGIAATSRSFTVAPPSRALKLENGFAILMENGFALLAD
jgi:hypothetical protein